MSRSALRNLFAPPAREGDAGERIEILAASDAVRIERIVSRGHASAEGFWYDQEEHEWVAVLQGSACLLLRDPDERLELRPGDAVSIAAHRPHRVEWTAAGEDTVWLAVFYRAGSGPG